VRWEGDRGRDVRQGEGVRSNEALHLPACSHVEHNPLTVPDTGAPHNTGMVCAMLSKHRQSAADSVSRTS